MAQGRRGVGKADDRVAQKIREHELGQPQHLRRHVVQRSGPVVRGPRQTRVGPGQRELDAGRERLLDLVDVAYLNEVELHGDVEGPGGRRWRRGAGIALQQLLAQDVRLLVARVEAHVRPQRRGERAIVFDQPLDPEKWPAARLVELLGHARER